MLKAAVHEYHGLVQREHKIGPTQQITAMKPEAASHWIARQAQGRRKQR
jgi:hypothetical protein